MRRRQNKTNSVDDPLGTIRTSPPSLLDTPENRKKKADLLRQMRNPSTPLGALCKSIWASGQTESEWDQDSKKRRREERNPFDDPLVSYPDVPPKLPDTPANRAKLAEVVLQFRDTSTGFGRALAAMTGYKATSED